MQKCDLVRAAMAAAAHGKCCLQPAPPPGCTPDPACAVFKTANAHLGAVATQLRPGLDAEVRAKEADVWRYREATAQAALVAVGATAEAAAVTWGDFERCRTDTGAGAGAQYWQRADVMGTGAMSPQWPWGGAWAYGSIWPHGDSPVPLVVDNVMNPDLFAWVVLVFVFLVASALLIARRACLRGTRSADDSDTPETKNESA